MKKIFIIVTAMLLGAIFGAYLGYGPLLQYRSETNLSMEMSTVDYKRFTDLVTNQTNLKMHLKTTKSPLLTDAQISDFTQIIKKNNWYQPIQRISKTEYKDLSDSTIKFEQEASRKKDKLIEMETEKLFGKDMNLNATDYLAFTNLKIMSSSSNSLEAVERVKWLGNYAQNTAALDAVEDLVAQWDNERKIFAERYEVAKLKNEFEVEQLKLKITNFKKAINNLPKSINQEITQTIEFGRDDARPMTSMTRLFFAEMDLMDIKFKNTRLERVKHQQDMVQEIVHKYMKSTDAEKTGLDRLNELEKLINAAHSKTHIGAEREKLWSLANDVSAVKSRLFKKELFTTQPETQVQIISVSPFKLILLFSFLFTLFASLFLYKKTIINFFLQKENSIFEIKKN